MPTDQLGRLAAADPALGRHLPDDRRVAIMNAIRADAPVPRRRRPRLTARRTLVIAVLVTLGAAGAGVAALTGGGQTPQQVAQSYASVIRYVPVPPGYRWPGADVGPPGGVFAGHNAALMQATGQATCAWWDYWRHAYSQHDASAMAAALAGHARVIALVPHHRDGQSEDAGGADASVFAYEALLVSDARAHHPARIDQYLKANCTR